MINCQYKDCTEPAVQKLTTQFTKESPISEGYYCLYHLLRKMPGNDWRIVRTEEIKQDIIVQTK